jgi:hypothetical protein
MSVRLTRCRCLARNHARHGPAQDRIMVAHALTKVVMLVGTAAFDVLDAYGASALIVNSSSEVLATTNWQWMDSLAA